MNVLGEIIAQCVSKLPLFSSAPLIVYACSDIEPKHFEDVDLSPLYICLETLIAPGAARLPNLNFFFNCYGGQVAAVRRLAFLLREYTECLHVYVANKAISSGTLLCLSADDLYLGVLGQLGPIDPQVSATRSSNNLPNGIFSQDVRALRQVIQKWLNFPEGETSEKTFQYLSKHIFPTSLGAFYRAEAQIRETAIDLMHLSHLYTLDESSKMIDLLMYQYFGHDHIISRDEARSIGIKLSPKLSDWDRQIWNLHRCIQVQFEQEEGHDQRQCLIWTPVKNFLFMSPTREFEGLNRPETGSFNQRKVFSSNRWVDLSEE